MKYGCVIKLLLQNASKSIPVKASLLQRKIRLVTSFTSLAIKVAI